MMDGGPPAGARELAWERSEALRADILRRPHVVRDGLSPCCCFARLPIGINALAISLYLREQYRILRGRPESP
jgi:hypothetical protein